MSGTRSREKCDRCRQDRQKCLPENRRWTEEHEPCQRCKERGYECGPSTRKRKRMSHLSFSSDSEDFDTQPNVGPINTIDSIPPAGNDASLPTPSQFTRRRTRTRTLNNRVNVGWIGDNPQALSSKTGQDLPPTGRKQCEMSCRKLLKELGDVQASRKNFVWDLNKLNEWERLLGTCVVFTNLGALYKARISAIDKWTIKLLDQGGALLFNDKGSFTECFLRRLEKFTNDFLGRDQVRHVDWFEPDQSTVNEAVRVKKAIDDAVYQSQKRKEIYSEAEVICDALDGHPTFFRRRSFGSEPETDAAYRRAASDIQQMCSKLDISESGSQVHSDPGLSLVSTRRGYPAPQLAYRACDSSSAFRLWSDPTCQNALDTMQRSLLHYAVDDGDLKLVRDIARLNSEIIKNAGTDTFGMSPLAIAAVRCNKIMFDLLFQNGAACCASDAETSVLTLAARFGNIDMVRQMLTRRPYLLNLMKVLYRAIEGQHEEPARVILECMRDQACYDEKELEGAAQKADCQRLHFLAAEIRAVMPRLNTRSETLQDIVSANFADLHSTDSSQSYPPVMTTTPWYTQTSLGQGFPPSWIGPGPVSFTPIVDSTSMNMTSSTHPYQQLLPSRDTLHEGSDEFR